jgi:hypothetical protein
VRPPFRCRRSFAVQTEASSADSARAAIRWSLRQFRALLTFGGVVGVRDVDWGSKTFYPENQGIRRFLNLYYELARCNGGEPNAGRYLRHWFREAGFVETRVTTSTVSYTDPAATREWADTYADRTFTRTLPRNLWNTALPPVPN